MPTHGDNRWQQQCSNSGTDPIKDGSSRDSDGFDLNYLVCLWRASWWRVSDSTSCRGSEAPSRWLEAPLQTCRMHIEGHLNSVRQNTFTSWTKNSTSGLRIWICLTLCQMKTTKLILLRDKTFHCLKANYFQTFVIQHCSAKYGLQSNKDTEILLSLWCCWQPSFPGPCPSAVPLVTGLLQPLVAIPCCSSVFDQFPSGPMPCSEFMYPV